MAEYQIKTDKGFLPVQGTKVGKYLGVRKLDQPERRGKYAVDHIPSGLRVGTYMMQKTAKTVAMTLDQVFGATLAETSDTQLMDRMRSIDVDAMLWTMRADDIPTLEAFRTYRREQERAEVEGRQIREKYDRKVVHFISHDSRYGLSGTFRVGSMEGPGVVRGSIQVDRDNTLMGSYNLSDIALGVAPKNMPWVKIGAHEEIGVVNGYRWQAAQVGKTGLLWTPRPDSPVYGHSRPREFEGGIEAAKEFAESYGKKRSTNPTKARLMR